MDIGIALAVLALLAVLLGSAWMRRDEWELTGESRTMMLGLALCSVAVMLILAGSRPSSRAVPA